MRIGIDLGGTKIEAVCVDEAGNKLDRIRLPTPKGDYEETLRVLIASFEGGIPDERMRDITVGNCEYRHYQLN